MHKTIILQLLLILALCVPDCVLADTPKRYTILEMNTPTVTIGGHIYKVNDTLTLVSPNDIVWGASNQYLKVRDKETGQLSLLTKKTPTGKGFFQRLGDYLVKKKLLSTRDISPSAVSHLDSLVQLVDTITFSIERQPQNDFLYIATFSAGDFKQRTKLPTSPDGTHLYLTRDIYGHYARPTTSYIAILRYDLRTNAAPDSLGYLYVQPLPLHIDIKQ